VKLKTESEKLKIETMKKDNENRKTI